MGWGGGDLKGVAGGSSHASHRCFHHPHQLSPFSHPHSFFLCCCDRLYVVKTKKKSQRNKGKETEMEGGKERAREEEKGEKEVVPRRIGLTPLMTRGSAPLLNSLHYWQGGRENNTCCCSPRQRQLGQQALWECINSGRPLA